MATGTAKSVVTPPPLTHDRQTVQIIERQLGRARFHVKLVDLLCQGALLVVVTLVYLLAAAVADHWLLPGGLGFIGRALALVGLIGLCIWFAIRFFAPLVLRGINPTYAARTIEESQPSLKNSLINFLMLRQDRGGVREAVFEAVEQKAAADISRVQVESAIDRAPVIRLGYVLVGVMALVAAYKILSPKDPFQTVARVAMPWADIARPSRVQILEVVPGNAQVYHGHTIPISATINGTSEDSPVWLIYSTADGQTVDRKLRMKSGPGGVQFKISLPPEESNSPAAKRGMQQDVIYRVEAGDAVTDDYRLSVVPAPTIVVQQLEYEFPAYTRKPRQTLDKQGDIQAIDGTKVTIHALANQPIQSAWLELDPNDSPLGAAEILPLQFDGQRAWGSITLQINKSRAPWRTSYQVRFTNAEGNKSEQPIRHQIDVLRDLPPEVQILAPSERRIEVPENGSRPIEVRGIDPDFGLTKLTVTGDVRGKQALSKELLADAASHPPQARGKFVFQPQQHGLKAGDELVYQASASDNRTNSRGEAEPNVATTGAYVIVIVPPVEQPAQQDMPPPDGDKPPLDSEKPMADGDRPPMPMGDKPDNAGQEQNPDQQPGEKDGDKPEQPMQGENQGEKSQGTKSGGQKSAGQKSKGQKSEGQKSAGQKSAGEKSEGEKTEQEGSAGPQDGGTMGQSQAGGKNGEKSAGQPQQENPTDGSAGDPSQDANPSGSPSGNASQRSGNQGGQAGENAGEPTGTSDQPAKPAHDGDAIERINRLRQEKEEQSGRGENQRAENQRDSAGDPPPGASDVPQENTQREPMPGHEQGGKSGTGQKTDQSDSSQGDQRTQQGMPPGDRTKEPGTSGDKTKSDKGGKQSPTGQKQAGAGDEESPASPAGDQRQPGDKAGTGADKKQGEGNAKDKAGGQGGNPQGPMKTEKAEPPQPGQTEQGEPKEPGMGKNGESGAGDASKNEKGSGDSQEAGRDRPKEMTPDSSQPKQSDPSTPSSSKRQSDSQGNDSGDKSGGGKQGAGQSTKQAGNDSAGENSPGDEGSGAAGEKGQGPTGKKGGQQQEAQGKTGAKGSEKGDGSSGKTGQGDAAGGSQPPESPDAQGDASPETNSKGAGANVPLGGGNRDRPPPGQPGVTGQVPDSDDANLEYAKKQTELALEYLKNQEHNPDPELLDRLGWTKEELQEFLRRWESLQRAASEDATASRELDESLRSLGLAPAKNRKRAGGEQSDSARDLRDSGGRTSAPKTYRDQFDKFRKGSR